MKKGGLLLGAMILAVCLGGCGESALEGDSKCVVRLADVPKELERLDENILEQFYISVDLENIYLEESVDVKLNAKNDFKEELKLQPGTYVISYCYASPSNLVPVEVESKQEKIELTKDNPMTIDIAITNQEDFVEWAWNSEPSRDILQEGAFSRIVQFEGQMIDLEHIAEYVEFTYEEQVGGYDRATIRNADKGVSITVLNEQEKAADWEDCKVVEVSFTKNNVIWGQGAYVGMDVKTAVHAQEGLYGKPDDMSGTVLVGLGYANTNVSWNNDKSGDKLTLEIVPDGDYISKITYTMEVFE